MIDITGHLAVSHYSYDFFFSIFFKQLNSHIQLSHSLGMSQKKKE